MVQVWGVEEGVVVVMDRLERGCWSRQKYQHCVDWNKFC